MTAYRKMETFPISTSAIDGIAFLSIKDTILFPFIPFIVV